MDFKAPGPGEPQLVRRWWMKHDREFCRQGQRICKSPLSVVKFDNQEVATVAVPQVIIKEWLQTGPIRTDLTQNRNLSTAGCQKLFICRFIFYSSQLCVFVCVTILMCVELNLHTFRSSFCLIDRWVEPTKLQTLTCLIAHFVKCCWGGRSQLPPHPSFLT